VRPDEDDGDSGWNTKLADHVMEEDLKKDALWGEWARRKWWRPL
jgi:hypothetical protein